ncbi:DUF4064 domain-containing protein [Sutcliffiella halmapala]|uniref:DUF4064 domain-containing protein n=1 Tax=Sutcliffiella halmapala TaxID=79882 RepID=UPI000994FBC1|nr:DUF4064 domain-containing protein [Sutcliffiella halmapala]
MKRTGEIALAIIGVVLSGFFAIGGVIVNVFMSDPEIQEELGQELINDPNMADIDAGAILGLIESVGPFLIILGIITVVLGLVGIFTIKGNKKPVLAGIMFILAALVIGVGTIGFGFLPAILFLIAGIMSFVRKPKVSSEIL